MFAQLNTLGYSLRWKTISMLVACSMLIIPSGTSDAYADNCRLVRGLIPKAKETATAWEYAAGFGASLLLVAGALIWFPPFKKNRELGVKMMIAAVSYAVLFAVGFAFAARAIPLPCSILQ